MVNCLWESRADPLYGGNCLDEVKFAFAVMNKSKSIRPPPPFIWKFPLFEQVLCRMTQWSESKNDKGVAESRSLFRSATLIHLLPSVIVRLQTISTSSDTKYKLWLTSQFQLPSIWIM